MTSHALSDSLALAAVVLGRVQKGESLTRALGEVRAEGPLRAAAQALAYAALRDYGRADAVLRELVQRPPSPSLAGLLLAALTELQRGGREAHTVVHQAVEAATRVAPRSADRAKSLVNGVLRNAQRREAELRAKVLATEPGRYRHPQWWIDRLRAAWPDEWQAMLEAGNEEAPMTLRVNARRMPGEAYLARLREAGIAAELIAPQSNPQAVRLGAPCAVDRLPGFAEGLVSVQDFAAQQAALLLDVQPGMRVLDACAAPGGKTAHIAELADCDLTAVDSDESRFIRLRQNLSRLKLTARVICADAAEASARIGADYQRILLDAPCSASGVVRRHPDIKWLRRASDLAALGRAQGALLAALWPRLAPGGLMLYATCSVFPEENTERVAAFLAGHNDAELLPIKLSTSPGSVLPAAFADNIAHAAHAPEEARRAASPLMAMPAGCQIRPGGDTDGFYFAMLRKKPG